MLIGTIIKRLRHEQGITQEQLAEYLGITSRAVSQWECDRTAPDISQLPALCHIFGVSSDELLGIDIDKNTDAIKDYINRANDATNAGNFEEGAQILSEAYSKFPRSYEIMYNLASALVGVYSRKGIKEYDKVYELCNRIIKECTDNSIRYKAIYTIATAYECAGNTDEMRKAVKLLPSVNDSYETYMVWSWKGDEDMKERLKYMSFLIKELLQMIHCLIGHSNNDGKMIHTVDEQKKLWMLSLDLLETLFPDGDYQYQAMDGEIACAQLVALYQRENDLENVWYYIEKGADFAIHCDTYGFEDEHTSLILRGYSDGGWIWENEQNHCYTMIEWLKNDSSTAILRDDDRFHTIIEKLSKVAEKN